MKHRALIVQEKDNNCNTNDKSKYGLPVRMCLSEAPVSQTVAPSKIEKIASSQVKSSKIYFKSVLHKTFITQAPGSFFHRPTYMHKIPQYI